MKTAGEQESPSIFYETVKITLLIVITSFIYSNTLKHHFVFDDSRIYNNQHIRIVSFDLDSLRDAWQYSEPKSRPVANITFALNYLFSQYNVAGYRLTNIFIHIVAGLLLFFLAKRTLQLSFPGKGNFLACSWLPFIVSLVWLVHPVQTQSVTYMIQRMNSLAAMFYLMSLVLYIEGRLCREKVFTSLFWLGSFVAGLLALGSKEVAITLPFFIVLYEWYFFQDLNFKLSKKRFFLLVAGLAGVAMVALFYLGDNPFAVIMSGYDGRNFTLGQRLLTELRVVFYYLTLVFYPDPIRLNLDHDFLISQSLLTPLSTILSLAGLLFMGGAAVRLARKERIISFAILWFLGNLLIESSIIPLEIVYEHRLYLPSMMVILAMAVTWYRYLPLKNLQVAVVVLTVMVFCFWTYQRNYDWADRITLWGDCIKKSPDKARPHNNLAVALKQAGRLDEAEANFRRTIKLDPGFFEAYNNLGNIMMMTGRVNEAVNYYGQGVSIKPGIALMRVNLGMALKESWRLREAREQFVQALKLQPGNVDARMNLYMVNKMLAASPTGN